MSPRGCCLGFGNGYLVGWGTAKGNGLGYNIPNIPCEGDFVGSGFLYGDGDCDGRGWGLYPEEVIIVEKAT